MLGLEELSREELIALVLQLRESTVALEKRVRQLERQGAKGNAMPWVSTPDEWVPHRPQGPVRVRDGSG